MKLVIGNQKTYMNKEEVLSFIESTNQNNNIDKNVIVCPSSLFISLYDKSNFEIGLQNVSLTGNGASTGEISATQIKSMNIPYCIVGHSERRQMFNETGEETNKKLGMLLNEEITPILCIGETKEERDATKAEEVITKELKEAFNEISKEELQKIIVAYEPIWSIGTGVIPTLEEIKETMIFIKNYIKDNYSIELKVLYGGSVSAKNIDELNTIEECNGYLIGGASSKSEEFNYIIKSVK